MIPLRSLLTLVSTLVALGFVAWMASHALGPTRLFVEGRLGPVGMQQR